MPTYTSFQDPARYEIEQQKMRQNSVQQILNMMMMMKQNRQQQSQQEIENRMSERGMDEKTAQREMMDRYYQAQIGRWNQPGPTSQDIYDEEFAKSRGRSEGAGPGKTIEDIEAEAAAKARGTASGKPIPPGRVDQAKDKLQSSQLKFIGGAIKRYDDRMKSLKGEIDKASEDNTYGVEGLEMPPDRSWEIGNLQDALDELLDLQAFLVNRPLTSDEWNKARLISSQQGRAQKMGRFWSKGKKKKNTPPPRPKLKDNVMSADKIPPGAPTATNPDTGERVAFINGQWVKIR